MKKSLIDGDSAAATFLLPAKTHDKTHDLSQVVRIVYGNTSFSFTGDTKWDAAHDMVNAGLKLSSAPLSVGRHGSNTSSSYVFLRKVTPECAVISVGKGISIVHPDEGTLSRLPDVGAQVYHTDLQGTITCVSLDMLYALKQKRTLTAMKIPKSTAICWLLA